ncbi:MAG: ABC transporter permease subunit [Clostridiales Family XIII bacterium]|jgi:ABC-2 type transport system permease protein|nr:ABC transporter permease subunit [Clostridiales Family XIII bacterium]
MRQFLAFSKKEFHESAATFRLYILLGLFVMFGMMSPLLAKLTPEIIKSLGDTGMMISVHEPTSLDAWAQFFHNVGQMGMLVLIIVFCGTMSNELSKGTLVNLLTKGMKRHTVIASKMFASSVLWTFAYLLCFGAGFAYTAYFWDIGELPHALLAFAAPWLFGELLLATHVFGGTLFGNIYGSLLSCIGAVILMNLLSILPGASKYNPVTLSGGTLPLLSGAGKPSDFIPAVLICAAAVVLLTAGSIVMFNRKKM